MSASIASFSQKLKLAIEADIFHHKNVAFFVKILKKSEIRISNLFSSVAYWKMQIIIDNICNQASDCVMPKHIVAVPL